MRLFEGTPFDRPPRCENCGQLEAECECPPPEKVYKDPSSQSARVYLEKRKRGKFVTIVSQLSAEESDLKTLLSRLKETCGAGGTLKDEVIEIQGDQLARVQQTLRDIGYRVR